MPFAAPDAEEVIVGTTVAVRLLNDEASSASSTPDRAFEVVVVLALPGAATVPERENTLYPLEQIGRHDSRVAAFVFVALVGHVADVIAVLKHLVERVERYRLLGCAFRGTARQSGGRDGLVYLLAGVVARGIQLEGFKDEWCPFLVQCDGAYLAAADVLSDVKVADLGLADAAAILDLLAHLVGDICAARLRLVLVYGVNDGLDHLALGCLAHVEDSGDDTNAHLAELALGDGRVDAVAENTIEVVDDDVVDVLLSPDPSDHLLKDGPLVDGRGGSAGLNEFVDHLRAE